MSRSELFGWLLLLALASRAAIVGGLHELLVALVIVACIVLLVAIAGVS